MTSSSTTANRHALSSLFRQVMETALRGQAEAEIVRRARLLYAEIGEEDRGLTDIFLPAATETLPSSPKRR